MLELMTPMWMSTTGSNSRSRPAGHSGVFTRIGGCTPLGSMQFGFTSLSTRSGTASARIACLSSIEPELSMASSRSILSTALWVRRSTMVDVVRGSLGAIGRSRQPTTPQAPDKRRPATVSRSALLRGRILSSFIPVMFPFPFERQPAPYEPPSSSFVADAGGWAD
jgi:hypothetical protein